VALLFGNRRAAGHFFLFVDSADNEKIKGPRVVKNIAFAVL
jgi:hypothetical protein